MRERDLFFRRFPGLFRGEEGEEIKIDRERGGTHFLSNSKKKLFKKSKGELKIEVIDWASEGPEAKPLWSETKAYALSALDSKKLWWKRVDKLLRDAGNVDASRAFVRISARAASVGDGAAAAIARTNAAIEAMLAKDALAVSLEDQRGAAAEEVAAAEATAAVVSSAAAAAPKTASPPSPAAASSSSATAAAASASSLSPAAKAAVDALITHAAGKGGSLPTEMLTQSFLAKASRKAASAAVAEAAERSDRAAANELRLAARDAAAADAAMSASVDGPDADAAALAAAAIAAYEAKQNSNNLTAPPPADVVGAAAPTPAPAKAPSAPPSAPLPPRLVALMSSSEARAAAARGAKPPASDSPSGTGWASSSLIWLTEPKEAAINPRPRLTATDFVQVSPSRVSFKLSSKGVAPYVALDTSFDGVFDDNNLLLVPWEPRTLTFTGRGGAAVAAFAKSLGVLSLADTLDEVSTVYIKPSSVN